MTPDNDLMMFILNMYTAHIFTLLSPLYIFFIFNGMGFVYIFLLFIFSWPHTYLLLYAAYFFPAPHNKTAHMPVAQTWV